MQGLASFLCGLIFGAGLMISGMTQPAKVLGFLDILGRWDPTLAFVMASALATSSVGYTLARQHRRPVFAAQHLWPAPDRHRRAAGRGLGAIRHRLGPGRAMPGPSARKYREPFPTRDRVRHRNDRRDERTGSMATACAFGHCNRECSIGKLGRLGRSATI